jgi:glyoxylase-like metal-dependent hydrolase (beta-lactamase superfamily II)
MNMSTAIGASEPLVTPLADGSVLRLGGLLPVDGRLSWAPSDSRGFQPVNCYLVIAPDRTIMIDTGVAAHE